LQVIYLKMATSDYKQVSILVGDSAKAELLVAFLADMGYEGFEETADGLSAFIPVQNFDGEALQNVLAGQALTYTLQEIAPQNWNAIWESGFEPVVVPGFVAIRAAFHSSCAGVQHEIIITPKMSFGTGHHATTYMMVQAMGQLGFSGKTVLDFGTGTGVLAILAEKLGAVAVLAIDNDDWSIDNATENALTNGSRCVNIQKAESVPVGGLFDIVLANINLNVIVNNLSAVAAVCKPGANVLLSGFLPDDSGVLEPLLMKMGFRNIEMLQKDNWLCLNVLAP
jgi:ribosomal protein L11 methyltransferase